MKILSLYDKKAERYSKPFYAQNLAVATRDFAIACKEDKSPMAMFPNDIELCYLGDFDENNGQIIPCKTIATITCAKEFVDNEKEQKNR